MASDFIGYTVLVTLQPSLQSPPNAKIQGVVANVVDHSLLLEDVILLWSGQRLPAYTLKSFMIADLEVSPSLRNDLEEVDVDLTTPTANTTTKFSHAQDLPVASPQPQPFVDPAILSYSKAKDPPKITTLPTLPHPQPPIVSPVMIADGAVPSPIGTNRFYAGAGQSSVSSIATILPGIKSRKIEERRGSSAVLTEPFDAMALNTDDALPTAEDNVANVARKTRRGGPRKVKDSTSQTGPGIIDMKDITNASLLKKESKGKGWRQTPLVEETSGSKRNGQKSRRARKSFIEDANGWATEDATDIQDMGEFDFESNLSKFDKRRVFDDIRKDDTTADGERLVSFNRIAKPGTNGGRNLHFTENVLDPEPKPNHWQSEAGETEDEPREEHYSSGRGSKRAGSRKPIPSRRGSTFPTLGQSLRTESPRPLTRVGTAASPLNGSVSGIRGSFRMTTTNKPCNCVSPLQILEIEQLCTSELGLTEDILSENAGRSIAEAILKDHPQVKVVLFLVGNHKSGARAVTAARHLRNRRLRVTVCVLGGEREDMLMETLRKQLTVYQKGNGYVDKWDEFQGKLTNGPRPDVIVDALFGMHVTFDELRTDDQATAFEMIRWANRSAASIISIDVPSGMSASSGVITEVDGETLVLNPTYVICLAAPKTGLVNAMAEIGSVEWTVSVADIGISSAAWQKHGSRRKHGIEFGTEWVVSLKFIAGSTVV